MKWAVLVLLFLSPLSFAENTLTQRIEASLSPPQPNAGSQSFLPAEIAFKPSAWLEGERLYIRFTNAKGYYLHRHQFAITSEQQDVQLGPLFMPPGISIIHETLGEMEVFYDSVLMSAPINSEGGVVDFLSIRVSYQGCSDAGLCYMPQTAALSATARLQSEPILFNTTR